MTIETELRMTEELMDLEGKTLSFIMHPRREGQPEGSGEGVRYQGTLTDVRTVGTVVVYVHIEQRARRR